jgi:glycosyltransferase involved in cell wall biosynthesis
MNILFDHQVFSRQPYGGISRYFYEIANHIAGMEGQEVEICAPLYVNEYFRNDCRVRPRGIKIPHLRGPGRIVSAVNLAVSRLLIKPRRKVDIFHETYYSMADCCPRSAKRVITCHDMIYEKFPEIFPQGDITQRIKAKVLRRADHVICVSENTRRDLVALLDVPEEKTSVVYHGYSLTSTRQTNSIPAAGQRPYILYVGGRVTGYKNYESMLRAYASSPLLRHELSIICFGGEAVNARELALVKSLDISSDRVIHVSGSDDVLAGLYAAATVLVYPSMYEGFGISPLEAMSFGCPVVCANTSSLPEVVGDAAELFDPANEAEMRAAIERVVSSPERSQFLVDRGYERIKRFSWEKCAQDTLAVYNKILQM